MLISTAVTEYGNVAIYCGDRQLLERVASQQTES